MSLQEGGSLCRRSKLHLVDLAGSERVKKTDIKGKILTEAKYINLSLHYLEQVCQPILYVHFYICNTSLSSTHMYIRVCLIPIPDISYSISIALYR